MSRFHFNAQNRIFIPYSFTKLLALILVLCMMPCVTAHATSVKYIDENGNEKEVNATALTGNETYLFEGWYFVDNISGSTKTPTFTNTIQLGTNADVRIILSDGYTMVVKPYSGGGITTNASELGHLYIYGQSGGTGTLSIDVSNGTGIDVLNFTQYGGNIKIKSPNSSGIWAAKSVKINGGTLTINESKEYSIYTGGYANEWLYTGEITIKNGKVSADKCFRAGPYDYSSSSLTGKITLGLTSNDGYIKAGSYAAGTVKIADGQTLFNINDGNESYSGTLTSAQIEAIKGKTLGWATMYSYIDENGEEKSTTATELTASTATPLNNSWYIVNDDSVNITQKLEIGRGQSAVHIILADGKTLNIGSENSRVSRGIEHLDGATSLYIYGQKQQTGTLNIYATSTGIYAANFYQNGGKVNIHTKANDSGYGSRYGIFADYRVHLNSGDLSIDVSNAEENVAVYAGSSDWVTYTGDISINGGRFTASGDLIAGYTYSIGKLAGTITLGFTNSRDNYIKASNYKAGTVKVANGQILVVSGDVSGTLYSGDITASKDEIAGDTLKPYGGYAISYKYGLNKGESLINDGYIMLVSLDESVDVLSMYIDDTERDIISLDKRMYFTFLTSKDLSASTFSLKGTNSGTTSFIFESDNPGNDFAPGEHDIAVNSSATRKGVYVTAALGAANLNPRAYTTEALPMIVLNPQRLGYTFDGWTTSPAVSLTKSDDCYVIPANTTGNLTLTAKWKLTSYDITYELNGGTKSEDLTKYSVLTETFTLNNPTRTGYTFVGWKGTGIDGAVKSVTIPAGSTGKREYTAVWQKSFTPGTAGKPEIYQHAMTLGSQIVVMFYVYYPEGYTPAECKMSFDVSGDVSENNNPVAYTEAVSEDIYTLYAYPCYVNSVQMADTIHAAVYSGNECVLTEDYTAKTYLNRVIASADVFSSQTVNLCKAVKNYGHYVQIPLSKENDWEIGKDHKEMEKANTYGADDVLLAKQGAADYALSKDNAPDFTYALYLDSKTTLVVSFDAAISDLSCDSGTITDNKVVTIKDISAHELGNVYTIKGTNNSKTFTIEISPLSYVHSILTQDDTKIEGMTNGVTSLYHYYDKTMKYRMKH